MLTWIGSLGGAALSQIQDSISDVSQATAGASPSNARRAKVDFTNQVIAVKVPRTQNPLCPILVRPPMLAFPDHVSAVEYDETANLAVTALLWHPESRS